MLSILNFGAVGDGKFMNTHAFARAIEKAKETGEAIVVPAGRFLTGTIDLSGRLTFARNRIIINVSKEAYFRQRR